jgi:putative colanic acid biosynthesis acetyltransferase WcaF
MEIPNDTYRSPYSVANRVCRQLWGIVWFLFYRPSPKLFYGWRRFLLRVFGARIKQGAHPFPSCKVWAPWNLVMGYRSSLGPYVDCYNPAQVEIGDYATVSQYSYLCGATHDYTEETMPLVTKPIRIATRAWVAAGAFVGPGVTVEEGAVVGARACVFRDVPAWTVVAGNPARMIRRRVPWASATPGGTEPSGL